MINCRRIQLEGDLAVRAMDAAWTKVREALKTPLLWPLYQSYIQLAFHPCNLTAGQATAVSSYLQQVCRSSHYMSRPFECVD